MKVLSQLRPGSTELAPARMAALMRRVLLMAAAFALVAAAAAIGSAIALSQPRSPSFTVEYLDIDHWVFEHGDVLFVAVHDQNSGASCYGFVGALFELQCVN